MIELDDIKVGENLLRAAEELTHAAFLAHIANWLSTFSPYEVAAPYIEVRLRDIAVLVEKHFPPAVNRGQPEPPAEPELQHHPVEVS